MDIIFVVPKLFGDENTEVARVVGADNVAVKIDSIKQFSQSINSKYIEINSKLVPYQTDEEYFRLANSSTVSVEGNVDENKYFSFSAGYGKDLYSEVERYAIVASQIARDFEFDIIHCHDWLTYKSGIEAKKISRKPLVVHVHATETPQWLQQHK
jgi:glycogen synthase